MFEPRKVQVWGYLGPGAFFLDVRTLTFCQLMGSRKQPSLAPGYLTCRIDRPGVVWHLSLRPAWWAGACWAARWHGSCSDGAGRHCCWRDFRVEVFPGFVELFQKEAFLERMDMEGAPFLGSWPIQRVSGQGGDVLRSPRQGAFSHPTLFGWEGSPTKIDYRKTGTWSLHDPK